LSDVEDRGLDPLALRLAFLQTRYRQQANLTWDGLAAADRTLRRWRSKVAVWAESPSKPMCAEYVERVVAAFDDDLDAPTAIVVLRELERDEAIPPGAKFEAFAHFDRLFGLDLARDVGKPPAAEAEPPPGSRELLEARAAARAVRDWSTSDRLRSELAAMGVSVVDTPDGQQWTVG